jgi:hypothetical protein
VVKKFSQFPLSTPVAADQVVGAKSGFPNVLYTAQGITDTYRHKLTTTTNYYVATTGNDSTGTGAIGAPWLTLQHAIDFIANNVDFGGQQLIERRRGSFVGLGMKLLRWRQPTDQRTGSTSPLSTPAL